MNILVTGGHGFLGTALCGRLRADGHEVVAPRSREADLTQPDALEPYAAVACERIYHLAAWTQAGDFCLHHPGEQWLINQAINTTVLRWWQQRQPQAKLIAVGTSCAYDPDLPLSEEHYLRGQPIDSLLTYAMTKRMLYVGQQSLARQYGLRWLSVVPSTLYGPGYHTDGRQMHFIFDLIRKIIRGRLYGEEVVLWGDGHQRRELVFLPDFVEALLALSESVDNELVNLGAGEDHSIREFAALICAAVGYDPERIRYDTERYVGARAKRLEVNRLRALLPELRWTSLAEGLRATIRWFQEEGESVVGPPP